MARSKAGRRRWLVFGVMAVLLVASGVFVWWAVTQADVRMRRVLLDHARLLAQTAGGLDLQVLAGSEADLADPRYRRMKDHLMAVRSANPSWRFIYLMGRRADGAVFLYGDSEPEDSADYSPPGQAYAEATAELHGVFDTGRPCTEGPVEDAWGTWVSAFAPIVDLGGDVVALLGIDVDAADWKWMTLRAGLIPLVFALLLACVLPAGYVLLARRRSRIGESGFVLAIGLVLTAAVAWIAHGHETAHRRDAFASLAEAKTVHALDALQDLAELRVEALARFFESSEDVTRAEFDQFVSYLSGIREVRAWGWVSAVAAREVAAFEEGIRGMGMPEFRIWERDADGNGVPAAGREMLFPVTYLAPLEKRALVLGYDLGSEAARRAALGEAIRTGLVTATEPITLVSDQAPGVLVFRPVREASAPEGVRGLAMAVLEFQALLTGMLGSDPGGDPLLQADLVHWRPGAPPLRIASTRTDEPTPPSAQPLARPILACGRTFAVVSHPSAAFLAAHPTRLGFYTALAGAALSSLCAFAVGLVAHGRGELERMVREQTASLREFVARYNRLAAQTRSVTWEIDRSGMYTYVSNEADAVFGYRPDELIGRKHFFDIHPEEGREAFRQAAFAIAERVEPFTNLENPVQRKDGGIAWLSTHGVPLFGDDGEWIGYWGIDRDITADRQAKQTLKDEATRRRILIEQSRDGIVILDQNGRVFETNRRFAEMLGYTPEEMRSLHVWDWEARVPKDRLLEMIRTMDEDGDFFETRHRRRDGSTHDVEICTNGAEFAGQKLIFCVCRDITERKAAETRIRASEAFTKAVLDHLPIGIAVNSTDPVIRFEYMNDNFPRFYRTTREALSDPDAYWEAVYEDPEFRERIRRRILADCATGDPARMYWEDVPITRKGRETTYITARNLLVPDRDLMISVVWDVTARKRAEEDRDRIFTAMEQASEAIIITDAYGVIQYVNQYFERVSGFGKGEAVGSTPRILKSGKHDAAFYAGLWRTITAGGVWKGRLTNRRKDGGTYEEEGVISPVKDASGTITNYVAVMRDMTREAELQNQLVHAQKMESIGLLAGGIAHDFNNILTVILGNASILRMSLPEAGAPHPEIDEIEEVAMRAAEMTRQLLSFSRRDGGSPRRIDLNAILVGMQNMLNRLLPETIRSAYRLRDGELPVFADPGQVEQVLLNLVVNARDAIPENGVITIETALGTPHGSSAEVFFDSFEHAGREMAVIAVGDDGVGIEPAHLHRVFEPFFTTKEVGKGTGLGLSTVFGIVKQHEGTLSVQSEPGRGSTFRVYLPLTERGDEAPDAVCPEPARGGTETLLVVEDDAGVRQVAIRMLEDLGYAVIPAEDGASAIAIARAQPERIDLLLTDIIMPGIPGPDVARELRRIRPDLPVLYATGYPADFLARSGLSPEEFTIVHKPFSRAELARAVQAALRQRRSRDA